MITEKTKKKMSLARKRYWKKRKAALEAFNAKKPFDYRDDYEKHLAEHIKAHKAMILSPEEITDMFKEAYKPYNRPEIVKEKGIIETVMDYLKGIFS